MKNKCRRIVIANSKGGVGKTTSVLECAAHANSMSKKVLVVDMDPQGDATKMLLGRTLSLEEPHVFHLLAENTPIENVVQEATEKWKGIHIIPSDIKLTSLPEHLFGKIGYEKKLSNQLDKVDSFYDLILIDTGPQTTILTQLAMRAASFLLVPTDTSLYSEQGIERTLSVMEQLVEEGGHKISLLGIVFTAHHKQRANANVLATEILFKQYGDKLFKDSLPHCTKVQEAQRGNGVPVPTMNLLSSDHPLYLNYQKLTKNILGAKL